jgi:type III pantothenate kinase
MDLVLDLGNTNQKLALFRNDSLIELQQFPNIGIKQICGITSQYKEITHCILSSVVDYKESLVKHLSSNFQFLILDENTPLPVVNRYHTKSSLGKDRLAAAVAGHQLFPCQNVLIINAGTCITYDFVSSSGEYLGGAISPGIRMRFNA